MNGYITKWTRAICGKNSLYKLRPHELIFDVCSKNDRKSLETINTTPKLLDLYNFPAQTRRTNHISIEASGYCLMFILEFLISIGININQYSKFIDIPLDNSLWNECNTPQKSQICIEQTGVRDRDLIEMIYFDVKSSFENA